MFKSIVKSDIARRSAAAIVARYIRLCAITTSYKVENDIVPRAFWNADKPFILAFWHGQLLCMPLVWRTDTPMRMLISRHRDGELIARTIDHFGLGTIRGSSTKSATKSNDAKSDKAKKDKGGIVALRAMLQAIKQGQCVGVTPDGPHGPRMRAGGGIIAVARLSGVPIIPVAGATRGRTVLNSWDRFMINLPFSRGAFVWGEPLCVARDASEEETEHARQVLESRMNVLSARAHAIVHRPVVGPALLDTVQATLPSQDVGR